MSRGRKPLTQEQRAQIEPVLDTHIQFPMSLIAKIDELRKGESRKAFIVRVLSEAISASSEKC